MSKFIDDTGSANITLEAAPIPTSPQVAFEAIPETVINKDAPEVLDECGKETYVSNQGTLVENEKSHQPRLRRWILLASLLASAVGLGAGLGVGTHHAVARSTSSSTLATSIDSASISSSFSRLTSLSTMNQPSPTPTTTSAGLPSASTIPSTMGHKNYTGPKRGIVYTGNANISPFTESDAIGWAYNWGSSSMNLAINLNFVPMLWGPNASLVNTFASNAVSALKGKTDSLMAMDEPDQRIETGGSNLSPGDAVKLYKEKMVPFAGAAKLGAPAVSNANTSYPLTGVQWLRQFFGNCTLPSCVVNFVPFHWGGFENGTAAEQALAFQQYVAAFIEEMRQASGVNEFWITQFSASPSDDARLQAKFMGIVLPWLDSDPAAAQISRYSYFMVGNGMLVDAEGALTVAGLTYLAVS